MSTAFFKCLSCQQIPVSAWLHVFEHLLSKFKVVFSLYLLELELSTLYSHLTTQVACSLLYLTTQVVYSLFILAHPSCLFEVGLSCLFTVHMYTRVIYSSFIFFIRFIYFIFYFCSHRSCLLLVYSCTRVICLLFKQSLFKPNRVAYSLTSEVMEV